MKWSQPIFITDARRSPIGRFCGGLKDFTPTDLLHAVAQAMVPDALKPAMDQIIVGQVLQAGSGMNVARQLALRLGLPLKVPGLTVNMACASGLKAVALAADSIALGESSLALAGGVESMTRAPHYSRNMREGCKLGDAALEDAIFTDGLTDPILRIGMGETAERIVDAFHITREDQDAFAITSQGRAIAAREAFRREIVPIATRQTPIDHDEHPRADSTIERLAKLKPAFRPNGTITAGNASGINDGAALVLLASETSLGRHGLTPRARVVAAVAVGCDPATMGLGPVHAVRRLMEITGWNLAAVGAIEINEAFAAQTLACAKELGIDMEKLNRRGGAVALGHPVGCSGARVLVTLLHIMEDMDIHRGVASLCVGGGMGIAMAVERDH